MSSIKPLFLADWTNATFIHFAVRPEKLQPLVCMELDTFDGLSWVSLVAFTQSRLRLASGGNAAAWITAPLAHHPFLNCRTYVRDGPQRGILFMAEWIPNRLAILLGPALYGLPYRFGRIDSEASEQGIVHGRISAGPTRFTFNARIDPSAAPYFAQTRTLDHFLVERYLAFTCRDKIRRSFDVAHDPWPLHHVDLRLGETSLLKHAFPLLDFCQCVCAHHSPGVANVAIGRPEIRKSRIRSDKLKYLLNQGAQRYVQSPC